MDSAFGGGTDPMPYITMAYSIGAFLLFIYAAHTLRERVKLRTLLAAVKAAPRKR